MNRADLEESFGGEEDESDDIAYNERSNFKNKTEDTTEVARSDENTDDDDRQELYVDSG